MSDSDFIEIVNDRENNLQNISLKIPKNKLTVFTGVSGSGKSSIVFDTIAQEAGRQLNSTYDSFTRTFLPDYRRPDVDEVRHLSTAIVIDQKPLGGNARSTLGTVSDISPLLRILFSRFATPHYGDASNAFSFNDPAGMCPTCEGIGKTYVVKRAAILDMTKSLNEGAILLPGYGPQTFLFQTLKATGRFDLDRPVRDFTAEELDQLLMGKQAVRVAYKDSVFNVNFEGLERLFYRQNLKTGKGISEGARKKIEKFATMRPCPDCQGKRFNPQVLAAQIKGYNLYDLTALQLTDLQRVLAQFDDPRMTNLVTSIQDRVAGLVDIGLDYLSLTRETATLSGGESQRVKTVKYLANSLTNLLYILDEPSTGLHPRDVHRLNELLLKLRDKGNTVLVVEHDPDVIQVADYVVDVGPRAGIHGGRIMFTGTYPELLQSQTLTAQYLQRQLPINPTPRQPTTFLTTQPSRRHNLKDAVLKIPTGLFTVVTGVAGSGKSTLVEQVFAAEHSEARQIDQRPLHTNSRSNPATYMGVLTAIRKLLANENAVSESLFSANSKGACPKCGGKGVLELNLSFMENATVTCDLCHGGRFDPQVLTYQFKQRNIEEIMAMTVEEAVAFFAGTKVAAGLESLMTVGLEYLALGQPLSTLSGGEGQRLKIAKELRKRGNLYILDEPTTGLHPSDIMIIVKIINDLVDSGNTVVVIEHNLDVIRCADWLIDIGPDGGTNGGEILYAGPVAGVRQAPRSITGQYLKA
ncbi:ATP-binding cassette domain-containing protein [Levilactobacillus tujiorum]|uniref:UvrABC system protein A n=1 Tax=Levilactobacillus tujiorum TaxID=2912243 RepID=A0ABX1L3E7_9LACO|nr:excinuclease ABC subunit UvrA [Levilactobacillus tujiorum]MCH5463747.1 excinuclease ABC subunit UvrA [Levilactobacillus tujiorum]NLR10953.1 excinuclease ABC subunit UvrA [Lactobacillus sp. HBUAS51387]NLR28849.1 excinuclease ABC subunit UvrA [Levilactobacillus tujiorum]